MTRYLTPAVETLAAAVAILAIAVILGPTTGFVALSLALFCAGVRLLDADVRWWDGFAPAGMY
jgi:hypothetical protein